MPGFGGAFLLYAIRFARHSNNSGKSELFGWTIPLSDEEESVMRRIALNYLHCCSTSGDSEKKVNHRSVPTVRRLALRFCIITAY